MSQFLTTELLVSGDDRGKVPLWSLKDILASEADDVDELILEDEETQRRRRLFPLGMQVCSYCCSRLSINSHHSQKLVLVPNQTQANNDQPTVNQNSSTNHLSETDEASGCAGDDQHSLLDVSCLHLVLSGNVRFLHAETYDGSQCIQFWGLACR